MDDDHQIPDTSSAQHRIRQERLRRWKRSWRAIVTVCFLVVVGSAFGLADAEDGDTVQVAVFTSTAALAAVIAFMTTVARARVGSILGEGESKRVAARRRDGRVDASGHV